MFRLLSNNVHDNILFFSLFSLLLYTFYLTILLTNLFHFDPNNILFSWRGGLSCGLFEVILVAIIGDYFDRKKEELKKWHAYEKEKL